MNQFKSSLGMMSSFKCGFEGDRELSAIVRDFQNGTLKHYVRIIYGKV